MSETIEPAATGTEPTPPSAPANAGPVPQLQHPWGAPPAPHPVTYVTVVNPKSTGLAYVLLIFLGTLGIHKFYMEKVGMGILYLSLTFVGAILTLVYIGWLLIIAVWIMLFIELFTLAGEVERFNGTRQRDAMNNARPSAF